jgi:hypothetical protein
MATGRRLRRGLVRDRRDRGASREFFFGFGGRRPMVDDYYFGTRTGRLPDWTILGREDGPDPDEVRFEPVAGRYERVFTNALYEVYRLRAGPHAAAAP